MAAQRYPSDYKAGGYIDRAVNLASAQAAASVSELIADAMILITDDDPNNDRQAFEKLVVAGKFCDELVYTNLTANGGDLAEAKRRAKKMSEIGSESARK